MCYYYDAFEREMSLGAFLPATLQVNELEKPQLMNVACNTGVLVVGS